MPVVPVFISSTFKDFHGERDAIRRLVAPVLDARIAAMGARVELLDLRWGVDTAGTDDEAAQQKVLDVCFQEIDRCRPLFVGLVGDREGWTPPVERTQLALSGAGDADERPPGDMLSITALEFWHAARASGTEAVFAVRQLEGDVPPDWAPTYGTGSTWLREFAETRCSTDPDHARQFEYLARVSDGRVREQDLVAFTDQLIELLAPLVDARARVVCATASTPYETSAMLIEEARRAVVVGRDELIATGVAATSGSERGQRGVVLVGGSGVGKTTVWLAMRDQLAAAGSTVASVMVGAGPDSVRPAHVIRLLSGQLPLAPNDRLPDPGSVDDVALSRWWLDALSRLTPNTVIAIDGLDRLEASGTLPALDLLPSLEEATQVKFLVTTTDQAQADVAQRRGCHVLPVPAFEPEVAGLAACAWARFNRRDLPQEVISQIGARSRSGIWVRIAMDQMEWLDQSTFAQAEQLTVDGVRPDEALSTVMLIRAREFPDDDELLADRLLTRATGYLGAEPAPGMFRRCLSLTRSGLTSVDLAELCGCAPLDIARARWSMGSQLTERDASGRLAFDHQVVRRAAMTGQSVANCRETHADLARRLCRTRGEKASLSTMPDTVFRAVSQAKDEAFAHGRSEAGVEWLMIALASDQGSDAWEAATAVGFPLDRARAVVNERPVVTTTDEPELDDRVFEIIQERGRVVLSEGHSPRVVTGLDLLGALCRDPRGAGLLAELDVDQAALRRALETVGQRGYYGQDGHQNALRSTGDEVDVLDAFWHALNAAEVWLVAHTLQVAYWHPSVTLDQVADVLAAAVIADRSGTNLVLRAVNGAPDSLNMVTPMAMLYVVVECLHRHARADLTTEESLALAEPLYQLVYQLPAVDEDPIAMRARADGLEAVLDVLHETNREGRSEMMIELANSALECRRRLAERADPLPGAELELVRSMAARARVLLDTGERVEAQRLYREAYLAAKGAVQHDTSLPARQAFALAASGLVTSVSQHLEPLDPIDRLAVQMGGLVTETQTWAQESVAVARGLVEDSPGDVEMEIALIRALRSYVRVCALIDEDSEGMADAAAEALRRSESLSGRYPSHVTVSVEELLSTLDLTLLLPDTISGFDRVQKQIEKARKASLSLTATDEERRSFARAEMRAHRTVGLYHMQLEQLRAAQKAFRREFKSAFWLEEDRLAAAARLEAVGNRIRRRFLGWPSLKGIFFDGFLLYVLMLTSGKSVIESRGFEVLIYEDGADEPEDFSMQAGWRGRKSVWSLRWLVLLRLLMRVLVLVVAVVGIAWLFLNGHPIIGSIATLVFLYGQFRGQIKEALPG